MGPKDPKILHSTVAFTNEVYCLNKFDRVTYCDNREEVANLIKEGVEFIP